MADVRLGPFRENLPVTIDTSAVGPFLESKVNSVRDALAERMTYTSAMLQQAIVDEKLSGQLLKIRSGKLASSVRGIETYKTWSTISGGVTAGGGPVVYARSLEYGSKAHDILPRNAKSLHFFVDGKEIFTGRVRHPGTKAYAFMRGTLDEKAQEIVSGFQDAAIEGAKA